jgi:hypothetical protein
MHVWTLYNLNEDGHYSLCARIVWSRDWMNSGKRIRVVFAPIGLRRGEKSRGVCIILGHVLLLTRTQARAYPISTRVISTSFLKSSCRPKRQIRLFKSLFEAFPDQRITPTEIETFLVLRL